jgi:dTDP-4-amino-4,6-dideoxygalactose transaminase
MYAIGEAEIRAVTKVIQSGQLFRYRGGEGGWCDKFEAALAKKIGVTHALLNTSGTASLICALAGIGVEPGDEVIVPAYTFMASALAPLAAGAIPIIAEIDETLMLDPQDVKKKITRYTKAVMPVHMVGRVCDMGAFMAIGRQHKLKIVEDACQAVGGSYRGRRLTSIGHVGAFSFNFFKNITCGEGGAVMTSDLNVYDRALIYHDGGSVFRKYAEKLKTPFFAGANFRASEILGAIMFEQLKRLDGILARLRERQAAMVEELAKSRRYRICPTNEARGDCGSHAAVIFEKAEEAQAFVKAVAEKKLGGAYRPYDTGRHVYFNWDPIMKKHGSHTAKLNPYNWAKRKIEYSKDMCPRSVDIMARAVLIGVPYQASVAQARSMARKLAAL